MASSAVKSVSRTVKSGRANAWRGCQDPDMRRRSCLPACLVLALMSLATLAQAADRPPEKTAGGTLVEDDVDYAVPFGWPVDRLFVRRDLRQIFTHRQHAILKAFGVPARDDITVGFV